MHHVLELFVLIASGCICILRFVCNHTSRNYSASGASSASSGDANPCSFGASGGGLSNVTAMGNAMPVSAVMPKANPKRKRRHVDVIA